MHKFTDDTTLSENVQKGSESDMQRALDAVLEWSQLNYMNINCKKTKEMVLGSFRKYSSTQLTVASVAVERLPVYKLLGIAINCTVKWDDHVATVISSAAKRLWFLKKLKPAGVSVDDPVYYYQSIRPALEYACAVWHSVPTKKTNAISRKCPEGVRYKLLLATVHVICHLVHFKCRHSVMGVANCVSLSRQIVPRVSRTTLSFTVKRDSLFTDRLRSAKTFPVLHTRTTRYRNSYFSFALIHFQ